MRDNPSGSVSSATASYMDSLYGYDTEQRHVPDRIR